MSLGKKLQALRKQRGMSQEQLADALNVSRQAVSKWELDATLPDTANVVSLSRIFEVSTDYLLLDEEAAPQPVAIKKNAWRMIAGSVGAGMGALGIFVMFIISRFVKVMIPRVEYIDGTEMTTWDSSITGIDFGLFIEQYELEGLMWVFALMIAAGVVLLAFDRIQPALSKLRRHFGTEFY